MDRDTINTFFYLVYQNEKAEERNQRMSGLHVMTTAAGTKLQQQAGLHRIVPVGDTFHQTPNTLAKVSGIKRYFTVAIIVLVLWIGMLLVGCRSGSDEQEISIPAVAGVEMQEDAEVDLEVGEVLAGNVNEPETRADQVVGTWSLTQSDIEHMPHYYRQFTEDNVTCFDVSEDWLGKLPEHCASYSLEGNILTMVCPEDGGKVCIAGATCTYSVSIIEDDTLILEPDTEICSDFWKPHYGPNKVDIPHFTRVVQ